jgi:carboxypeptidase PM20D1
MKKIVLGFLALVLALIAVLGVRTLARRSIQIAEPPAPRVAIPASAAERLAAALRLETISYEKERAELFNPAPFLAFQDLLARSFPLVHSRLSLEKVNRFGLVYRWPGSRSDLTPILLLAHCDVVPVAPESSARWSHPPFGGVIADGFIWGRGALDDKGSLMGILESVELLLAEGVVPERSVYLAFGQDEEILGESGAAAMAALFKSEGRTFEFILDEGLPVLQDGMSGLSRPVALIGISEKGYASVELTVQAAGGHSSMPERQTAVGLIARAVARLEENPFPAGIVGPARDMFRAIGPEMTWTRRTVLANLWLFGKVVTHMLAGSPASNALIRTTTAPTILRAGIKDNVLPTEARAVVNFRILPGETVAGVVARAKTTIADERVAVKLLEGATEPSPVSSVDSDAYGIVQKAAVQVFSDVLAAPGLMIGATDSRHYIGLTSAIFRFGPVRMTSADLERPHGLNERISVEGYADMIRFYRRLILLAATGRS